jgi:hypothetical protein
MTHLRGLLMGAAMTVALVACTKTSDFDKEQKSYSFLVQNKAPKSELCEQAKRVEAAAINERRTNDYRLWRSMKQIECDAYEVGQEP